MKRTAFLLLLSAAAPPPQEEITVHGKQNWEPAPVPQREPPSIHQNGFGFGVPPRAFFDGTLFCGPAGLTDYAGQPATGRDLAFAYLAHSTRLCQ